MPNLRWMPTTSPNPEAEHKRFWSVKLTRPIDDPFWNKHRPGDRWNCKCSLEATDEPPTDIPDDADDEKPQRGLRGNPAKTGQIFDKSHPYFPKNCASCGFNRKKGTITSRLMGWFNAGMQNCYKCRIADNCVEKLLDNCRNYDVLNYERRRILSDKAVIKSKELAVFRNLRTQRLLRSSKSLDRLLVHCKSMEEIRAAMFVWNNPHLLKYKTDSKMGEGKDMSLERNQRNVMKKKKRHVRCYQVYEIEYDDNWWLVKLEEHLRGFEQPYHIRKIRNRKNRPS